MCRRLGVGVFSEVMNELPPTSARLMQDFVATQSRAAFEALVERYLPMVRQTAYRCTRNRAAADDVAQQVFIDFARRLPRLRPSEGVGAWLHRSAVFRSKDLMKSERRRRRRERSAAMLMDLENLTEDDHWEALSPVVDSALQELRTRDREVIVLRYLEGHGIRDMVSLLEINESTVKKRLERALSRLRAAVRGHGVTIGVPLLVGVMLDKANASVVQGLVKPVSAAALDQLPMSGLSGWWYRHGPVPRIALYGAGVGMLVGGLPLWMSNTTREFTNQALLPAASALTLQRSGQSGRPSMRARPFIQELMTVPEIVDALGQLFAQPLSELDKERCRRLFQAIPDHQAREALRLMDEEWSPAVKQLCDESYVNARIHLCETWAQHQPKAALAWVLGRLQPEVPEFHNRWRWQNGVANVLEKWARRDWDAAWEWVQEGVEDGSLLLDDGKMEVPQRIASALSASMIDHLGLRGAIDALANLHNRSPSGSSDAGVLSAVIPQIEQDEDFQYLMAVIPGIVSPTSRVHLREIALRYWARHHRASAYAWVEALPMPLERSRFGITLAFECWPKEGESRPDYRALAAWWASLDPDPPVGLHRNATREVVQRWLYHDPEGAAVWLRNNGQADVYGPNVVTGLAKRDRGPWTPGPGWEEVSLQLIRAWKEAYPERFASTISLMRRNNRHRSEVIDVLNRIDAQVPH